MFHFKFFSDHPASVGETYFEHMRTALGYSAPLLTAGLAAAVHAFLPFSFKTTASATIRQLHDRMSKRRPRPAIMRRPDTIGSKGWDPDFQI